MRARVFGHPIHPMLVPLPIGLWTFSLVCDLVFRFVSSDPIWNELAYYSMAGGIAGALLAAVPGFLDFLSIEDRRVRVVAFTHMLVNLSATAVYAINFLMRGTSPAGSAVPFYLSIAGFLVLGVGGWLGGELVFQHGVAVEKKPAPPPTAR